MNAGENWALKAIEDEAMKRAMAMFTNPEYMQTQLRFMGLSYRQIVFLKTEWRKAHPGEEIPE